MYLAVLNQARGKARLVPLYVIFKQKDKIQTMKYHKRYIYRKKKCFYMKRSIFHLILSVHLHSLFPTMIRESLLFLSVHNSSVQLLLHNKHITGFSLKTLFFWKKSNVFFYLRHQFQHNSPCSKSQYDCKQRALEALAK